MKPSHHKQFQIIHSQLCQLGNIQADARRKTGQIYDQVNEILKEEQGD